MASRNLERRHTAFNDDYVITQLTFVANQFKSERTPSEWELLYEDYANNLLEFPTAIVTDILADHRRSKTWFPKLGELVPACQQQLAKEREDHRRIRILLGREEPKSFERPAKDDPDARPRAPEEIARLLAMSTKAKQAGKLREIERRPPLAVVPETDEIKAARMKALQRRMEAENMG